MKKIFTVLILIVLIGGAIFLVRHKKQRIAMAPVQKSRTVVRTAMVTRGDLEIVRTYLARVEPWQSAGLRSQIISRIADISVQEGDLVSRGQIVAVLDTADLQARVRGAQAGVARSRMQVEAVSATMGSLEKTVAFRKHEFERDILLVREGALAPVVAETSADRLSEVQGRLKALQKTIQAAREEVTIRSRELEHVRATLAYARIRAPFAGKITGRLADPGDMAGPGEPLVTIEDHHRFKICFEVPQSEMTAFTQGMHVRFTTGADFPLAISRIHPALNQDRTVTVECDTPEGVDLTAGSTVSVAVILHRFENELLLPEAALIPAPDGGTTVFAVINGVSVSCPVTVIGRDHGMVAVGNVVSEGREKPIANASTGTPGTDQASKLGVGTAVVCSTYLGWNRLAAGEPVEVQP